MVPVPTSALVTLPRFAYSPHGTFGRLSVDGGAPFYTVERPWANNAKGVSCIPCGTYVLKLGMFYSGDGPGGKRDYPAYEILGVPGRDQIKIHVANYMTQVEGCVAPGMTLGYNSEVQLWAVRNSQQAFDQFMNLMAGRDGQLVISNYVGGIL